MVFNLSHLNASTGISIGLLCISLLAGLLLFTAVLNSRLAHVRLRGFRKILTLTTLTLCVVGFGVYALKAHTWPGWQAWYLPLVVLALAGTSALIQAVLQQRLQFSRAQVDGRPIRLFHPVTTTDLIVSRFQVSLAGWQGPAVRVVHLTDFHVTDQLPLDYYQQVVQRTRDENPDLILLTGDFISHEHQADLFKQACTGLNAPLGVYAILGNHDWAKDPKGVLASLRKLEVKSIGGKLMHVPGHPALTLAGDELPWGTPAPLNQEKSRPGDALLVLTHTPDNIYRLAASQVKPQVVFGGHFHGGQWRLPGFGPIVVPSRYGRRFTQGHFLVNGTHLFVSAGIGAASPAVRLYCQPEIVVVDLVPA